MDAHRAAVGRGRGPRQTVPTRAARAPRAAATTGSRVWAALGRARGGGRPTRHVPDTHARRPAPHHPGTCRRVRGGRLTTTRAAATATAARRRRPRPPRHRGGGRTWELARTAHARRPPAAPPLPTPPRPAQAVADAAGGALVVDRGRRSGHRRPPHDAPAAPRGVAAGGGAPAAGLARDNPLDARRAAATGGWPYGNPG